MNSVKSSNRYIDSLKSSNRSSHLVPIRTFVFSHEGVPARQQACKLTLENLPDKVYETDWDRIMIDASKGYFAEAPARMAAVFSATVMARNRKGSGEDGGVGGEVRCGGTDRDHDRLGVVGEVHRAEVVGGAASVLKECGDELARGVEVGLGEELEEDMVEKDVDEGGRGEVVVNGEVGVEDGENGEGGTVREICDQGVAKVRREVNWESFGTVERRAVRLLMFGDKCLEKEVHMKKEKKMWDNES
ncbi:hypothetical protein JHK85_024976 [Glycine max]|nr:hypothetical protein JHK85_024976 [Glycine max]